MQPVREDLQIEKGPHISCQGSPDFGLDKCHVFILKYMSMRILVRGHLTSNQRRKNLGGRVALPPGKFLRVRKVFARINKKTF